MIKDYPSLGVGARVSHPEFGEGIATDMDERVVNVFFRDHGDKEISRSFPGLKVLESPVEVEAVPDLDTVAEVLRGVLEEASAITHPVEMGARWNGGTLVMKPGKADLQSKEVPIDTFFHKIVMVRDRLRVLEQNINSHPKLDDADRVHLQQYISRIYGSLTTFNILFADKEDHFSGK